MTTNMPVRVRDFMSPNPINFNENDNLTLVLSLFEQGHFSGALIINELGDYVGVLSKTNLLCPSTIKLLSSAQIIKVKDIMSPSVPLMVGPDTPLDLAAKMMVENNFHRLFVCNQAGRAIGIISSFDVMRAYCQAEGVGPDKPMGGLDQRLFVALNDCKKAMRKS